MSDLGSLVSRLEAVTARLEKMSVGGGAPTGGSTAGEGGVSPALQAFEDFLQAHVNPWIDLSKKIGGDVADIGDIMQKAFAAQRDFLNIASKSKKPDAKTLQDLLKPTAAQIDALQGLKSRRSEFTIHINAAAEGAAALAWVAIEPTPVPHVKDMLAAADFYLNKVLVAYKGKSDDHLNWSKGYKNMLNELANFVKANHTTGVTWNPKGGDASSAKADAPKPTQAVQPTQPTQPTGGAPKNLFAELNKDGLTSGLRKVKDEEKSKNRTDKVSTVPDVAPPVTTTKKEALPDKPPKFELEGSKWAVEYQKDNKTIQINDTNLKQTVYIFKCHNSVIQIKGKVNTITVDNCTRTTVVFENVVASADVVNCKGVTIQTTGKVPNVTIDKSSGVNVYLSKESLDTPIVHSTSDQINVNIPLDDEGDFTEMPVAEQFVTKVVGKKLVTDVNKHA